MHVLNVMYASCLLAAPVLCVLMCFNTAVIPTACRESGLVHPSPAGQNSCMTVCVP